MQTKKLIFNADDFGLSENLNKGIYEGFASGLLTSTCVCANGNAFDSAITEYYPQMDGCGIGVHLNIIEGKTVRNKIPRNSYLCDFDGNFNNGYLSLMLKADHEGFKKELKEELRAQIEKILSVVTPDHINSHVHTHAIPSIFEIVCELTEEYGIKYIRTQYEQPYMVPSLKKHLTKKYPVNLLKVGLLNCFTKRNFQTLEKYNLQTNDYLIGVSYTGYMDENSIKYGLRAIKNNKCIAEILLHPWFVFDGEENLHPDNYREFLTTQSKSLREEISLQNWELATCCQILQ